MIENIKHTSGWPTLVYSVTKDSTVFSVAVSNSYSLKYRAFAYDIHLSARSPKVELSI